jgi:hypothetical protein
MVLLVVRADDTPPPASKEATQKILQAAREERVKAAVRYLEATGHAYDAQTVTIDQLIDALDGARDAQLAVATTAEQQIAVLEKHYAGLDDLERRTKLLFETGTRGGEAAQHALALREKLSAEISLLEARLAATK